MPEREQFVGDGGVMPKPAGGILRVRDDKIDALCLLDIRQMIGDDPPAGGTKRYRR